MAGLWDTAAFGTGSPAETAEKAPNLFDKLFSGAVNSLATLPQRAPEPAMAAILQGARDQLASQPARLPLPDVGDAPVSDGGQFSPGVPVVNRAADIASRVPGHVIGGMGDFVAGPGHLIKENPYPPGSEESSWYEDQRAKGMQDWSREAAMNMMGTGAIAGVPVRAGEAVLGAGPIRAYHGSPHDFDKFSLDKIGTGEGAQAYGHGLYFAEHEPVAKQYRDQLQWRNADFNDPQVLAQNAIDRLGDRQAAADNLQSSLDSVNRFHRGNPPAAQAEANAKTEQAIALLRGNDPITGKPNASGKMYEVNINADPEHFLDWDKPLAEQHPKVQEALRLGELPQKPTPEEANAIFALAKQRGIPANQLPEYQELQRRLDSANSDAWQKFGINPSNVHTRPEDLTGGQFVQALEQKMLGPDVYGGKSPIASQTLRDAGIPGIKYLDQGSRATGEGSRNYVVFNDKIIDIFRKYGVALPGGAAAADMYARQDAQ